MKYLLPKELGGGEIEAMEFVSNVDAVYRLKDTRMALSVPIGERLQPVAPPIPEEPGPGAYLIGDESKLCVRFPGDESDPHWIIQGAGWMVWGGLLDYFGGLDVKIQRLVPEPEQEPLADWERELLESQPKLPYRDGPFEVDTAVGCGCHSQEDGAQLIRIATEAGVVHTEREQAIPFARAILTAAGEP